MCLSGNDSGLYGGALQGNKITLSLSPSVKEGGIKSASVFVVPSSSQSVQSPEAIQVPLIQTAGIPRSCSCGGISAGSPTSDKPPHSHSHVRALPPASPSSPNTIYVNSAGTPTDADGGDVTAEVMSFFTQVAKITDHLYLCAAAGVTPTAVTSNSISHVINLTMDVPALRSNVVETTRVSIDDVPGANLGIYFDQLTDKIRRVKERGGRTLVHCVAGVSRSASICIAYLMKYYRMPLLDAYRYVRGRRPVIRPNAGFFSQLIEYERRLFGKNTVRMVDSAMGYIPDVYADEVRNMVPMHHPPANRNRRAIYR